MPDEPIDPEPVPADDRAGRLRLVSRLTVDTRPLRHRDFRSLWIGQAISTIGGMIGTVAVPFQMYDLTRLVPDDEIAAAISLQSVYSSLAAVAALGLPRFLRYDARRPQETA